jgi:hypothetical protein
VKSIRDRYPRLILLLGSFDPETKSILYMLREHIAEQFTEHIYGMLIENIEVYLCRKDEEEYALIVEGGVSPVAYLYHLLDLVEVVSVGEGGDVGAKEAGEKLGIEVYERLPLLEKLKALLDIVCLVFLVRHRELTRGGEYIELTFLLDMGAPPSKIKFLWNKSIPISSMVKELFAVYGFTIHPYVDSDELRDEVHRIIYYNCLERYRLGGIKSY